MSVIGDNNTCVSPRCQFSEMIEGPPHQHYGTIRYDVSYSYMIQSSYSPCGPKLTLIIFLSCLSSYLSINVAFLFLDGSNTNYFSTVSQLLNLRTRTPKRSSVVKKKHLEWLHLCTRNTAQDAGAHAVRWSLIDCTCVSSRSSPDCGAHPFDLVTWSRLEQLHERLTPLLML